MKRIRGCRDAFQMHHRQPSSGRRRRRAGTDAAVCVVGVQARLDEVKGKLFFLELRASVAQQNVRNPRSAGCVARTRPN